MPAELKERMSAQLSEALSPLNRWYAGVELGREATDEEAVVHYLKHGGAEGFAKREKEEWYKKEEE